MSVKSIWKSTVHTTPLQDIWPKPEELRDDYYAITISPDPCGVFYPMGESSSPMSDFAGLWMRKLRSLLACDVKLWLEFSKTGRWHFHGFMKVNINKKYAFYFNDIKILQEGCNIDVRVSDTPDSWHLYCVKNAWILERELPWVIPYYDSQLLKHQRALMNDDVSQFVKAQKISEYP